MEREIGKASSLKCFIFTVNEQKPKNSNWKKKVICYIIHTVYRSCTACMYMKHLHEKYAYSSWTNFVDHSYLTKTKTLVWNLISVKYYACAEILYDIFQPVANFYSQILKHWIQRYIMEMLIDL